MAFCPNCGAEAQGTFCAKCGSQLGTATASTAGGVPPPPPAAPVAQAGLDENVASALCYLLGLITGVLFLVLEPYNRSRTVRFHAFQAIFLNIAWFIAYIGLTIIAFVPVIGTVISLVFTFVLPLVALVLWLLLMYKAYNGQKWVLPIVGPIAEKQA
jgi:uncharacterized membrane protein